MKRVLRGLLVPAVAVLTLAVPGVASADVVANWQMNEARGAKLMADASGNGFTGTIGNRVTTGVPVSSGNGAYNFPGPAWGYDPGRLVTIPESGKNDSRLDPGTGPYAVTVRFRTTAHEPNIIQKGQAGQTGGYWKLVLNHGWPRCHFRDSRGVIKAIGFVDGPEEYQLNDNQWHTVRCERTATGVKVTINPGEPGAVSKFIRGTIGTIDNKRPFLIGGKLDCLAEDVGCDYMKGQIDYVIVEKG